jgi:aminomuconate-semialdehyde/2-hydroxymuconate-6-semialdehyde dehydrogenase
MKIKNYINGKFVSPSADEWIDNYNPSNGEVYAQIPNSSSKDVAEAYKAAKNAFPAWSNSTLEERSRILIKISELLEENLQRFAEAESKDNGKPTFVSLEMPLRNLQVRVTKV